MVNHRPGEVPKVMDRPPRTDIVKMDYKLVPIDREEERIELINMLNDGWFLQGGPVGDTHTREGYNGEDYIATTFYQAVVKGDKCE